MIHDAMRSNWLATVPDTFEENICEDCRFVLFISYVKYRFVV